jgi:hypothetical protein
MTFRHVAALFVFGLACSPALAAHAPQESDTVDRVIPFPSNGTLRLKNFSGHVQVTASGGRDIILHAVRTATRDRLDHIKLDIATSGSTVTIDANQRDAGWNDKNNNVVETDFDLQVPAALTLDVDAFSSPVNIVGVVGDQKLKTFSGSITVKDARGAVSAETFSGKIDVDASLAGASPALSLKTFSAPIVAHLAPGAAGTVEFDSFSGKLKSDLPLMMHSASPRNITADLPGGSGHTLDFHTFSGGVTISR